MRITVLVKLAMAALLFLSCDSGNKKKDSEIPYTVENDTIRNGQISEDDQDNPLATNDLLASLQGKWERTTYPYGSVAFKGKQVKFAVGEGRARPPEFQNFRLVEGYPYCDAKGVPGIYLDLIALRNRKECTPFKLNGDTLSIYFAETEPGTVYTRMSTDENGKVIN